MSGEVKVEPGVQAPQCQFFVQRKKRLCRMTVKPGRQFCGEHEPQPKCETGEVDRRIPCPNDPKHTCYASKLEKHQKICNARRTEQPPYIVDNINAPDSVEASPRKPLSTIPKDLILKLVDKVNHLYAKLLDDHIKEEPPQPIHHAVLPEFSEPDRAESSLRHLRQTSELLWIVETEGLVRDGTCYVELGAGKGQLSYYACHAWCGARAGRVLAVDRAPLRHKRDNKLRSAPPRSNLTNQQEAIDSAKHKAREASSTDSGNNELNDFKMNDSELKVDSNSLLKIEDDKMKLKVNSSNITSKDTANSNGVTEKLNDDENTVVMTKDSNIEVNNSSGPTKGLNNDVADSIVKPTDDMGDRMETSSVDGDKAEEKGHTELNTNDSNDDEVSSRLRADLAHLALEAVPAVAASSGVVGIAKHLCGVATDYALRCVAGPGVLDKTHGIVLATCCHHRCERAAYVGMTQLQELGIDAEEFNIMLGIVSWATSGDGRSRELRSKNPDHNLQTDPVDNYPSREQREVVGRKAKALLDWGRVLWLRERGLEARLCHYVPRTVSLENVCLVARKK